MTSQISPEFYLCKVTLNNVFQTDEGTTFSVPQKKQLKHRDLEASKQRKGKEWKNIKICGNEVLL